MSRREERIALVTGAAHGIGRVTTRHLIDLGWTVDALDIDTDALGELATDVGPASTITADVTDDAVMRRVMDDVDRTRGRLDVLVNNAALTVARRGGDEDLADWDRIVTTNTRAVAVPTHTATQLLARGHAPAVVNVGSIGGTLSFRGVASYVASKGAVAALTRAHALELSRFGIRVNAVAPGTTATETWAVLSPEEVARRGALLPIGRPVEAEEVAAAIAFLGGDTATGITGQVLGVDGGQSVQAYTPADEAPMCPAGSDGP